LADQAAQPELRVSHADRDRAVETLTAAASEGRLAAAELDDRVEGRFRPGPAVS